MFPVDGRSVNQRLLVRQAAIVEAPAWARPLRRNSRTLCYANCPELCSFSNDRTSCAGMRQGARLGGDSIPSAFQVDPHGSRLQCH